MTAICKNYRPIRFTYPQVGASVVILLQPPDAHNGAAYNTSLIKLSAAGSVVFSEIYILLTRIALNSTTFCLFTFGSEINRF